MAAAAPDETTKEEEGEGLFDDLLGGEEWGPVDEHLSEAHDAVFAGDAAAAENACRAAIAAAAAAQQPPPRDAYALLVLSLRMRGDASAAASAAKEWGRACGESAKQLLSRAEAAFLLPKRADADAAELRAAAAAMAAYAPAPAEPGALHAKVAAAAYAADAGLLREADALLAACEALPADDDLAEAVDVLAAWADVAARTDTSLRTLRERADAIAATTAATLFARDVGALAQALLLVRTLETEGAPACRAALDAAKRRCAGSGCEGDANMAAAEALLLLREGDAAGFARLAEVASNGANLLLTKRILCAKESISAAI